MMTHNKIIVTTTSENFWWGVYGFCNKTGWEDLSIFYENGERIGGICLNGKNYLRKGLDDLKEDRAERFFVAAIERYLADDSCHYWYYYDDRDYEDFYEVPYEAPKNDQGIKPRFMDIWHPDESIGLSTITSAIKSWAHQHLGLENCIIEIPNHTVYEDLLLSFHEHQELFGTMSNSEVSFTDQLIDDLSEHWKISKKHVLKKLKNSIK